MILLRRGGTFFNLAKQIPARTRHKLQPIESPAHQPGRIYPTELG